MGSLTLFRWQAPTSSSQPGIAPNASLNDSLNHLRININGRVDLRPMSYAAYPGRSISIIILRQLTASVC